MYPRYFYWWTVKPKKPEEHCSKQPFGSMQLLPFEGLWGQVIAGEWQNLLSNLGLPSGLVPSQCACTAYLGDSEFILPSHFILNTGLKQAGFYCASSLWEDRYGRVRKKAVGRQFVLSKVNQWEESRMYVEACYHLLSMYYVPSISLKINPSVQILTSPQFSKSVSGRTSTQRYISETPKACIVFVYQILISWWVH